MDLVCVDASLVVLLLLPDDRTATAERLWDGWAHRGTTPFGPPLLYAEVPSVIRGAVHGGRMTPQEGERAFRTFCRLGIGVSTNPELHVAAWELAVRHRQPKAYDTMYVAAAQAAGCDLWTADRRLVNGVRLPFVRWVGEV